MDAVPNDAEGRREDENRPPQNPPPIPFSRERSSLWDALVGGGITGFSLMGLAVIVLTKIKDTCPVPNHWSLYPQHCTYLVYGPDIEVLSAILAVVGGVFAGGAIWVYENHIQ